MNDFELDSSLSTTIEQVKNLQALFPTLKDIQFPVPLPSYITTPPVEVAEIGTPPLFKHIERTEDYQKKSLEILEQIQQNTAALYTITELINAANDKQDTMIELITEILTISKAQSKEEAESRFKEVLDKIKLVVDSADTIAKLSTIAITKYQFVTKFL